jgi:hypothetical protein
MDKQFKISVINTEFTTDFDKKTVTCTIDYKIKVSDEKMKQAINSIGKFVAGSKIIGEVYTAEATSKLHPEDEFDQHKGEQVARAKVEAMVYTNVSKYFYRVDEWYIENIQIPILMFMDKTNDVIGHNGEYIESF